MYISIYVIEDSSVSDMLLQLPQPPKLYNIKESTGHYNTIKQKRKIYENTKNHYYYITYYLIIWL